MHVHLELTLGFVVAGVHHAAEHGADPEGEHASGRRGTLNRVGRATTGDLGWRELQGRLLVADPELSIRRAGNGEGGGRGLGGGLQGQESQQKRQEEQGERPGTV